MNPFAVAFGLAVVIIPAIGLFFSAPDNALLAGAFLFEGLAAAGAGWAARQR